MEATEKSQGIDDFLTDMYGKDRKEVVRNLDCATCDSPNTEFRDELSRREYCISGMCQNCQDGVFDND